MNLGFMVGASRIRGRTPRHPEKFIAFHYSRRPPLQNTAVLRPFIQLPINSNRDGSTFDPAIRILGVGYSDPVCGGKSTLVHLEIQTTRNLFGRGRHGSQPTPVPEPVALISFFSQNGMQYIIYVQLSLSFLTAILQVNLG